MTVAITPPAQTAPPPDRWIEVIRSVARVGYILASSAPLGVVYLWIRSLAGRDTNVNVGIAFTASLVGVGAAVHAYLSARTVGKLREESGRLKERCAWLEKQIDPALNVPNMNAMVNR